MQTSNVSGTLHLLVLLQVKEFDTPQNLLQNPASMFNLLVEDTGPVASATLRNMAAQGPQDDFRLPSRDPSTQ